MRKRSSSDNGTPPEYSLTFKVFETVKPDAFWFNPSTGEIGLMRDGKRIEMHSTRSELIRPRKKGPKVLVSVPTDPRVPSVYTDRVLLSYEGIFSVDTSYDQPDRRVSVTAVNQLLLTSDQYEIKPIVAFEAHEVRGNPERHGWALALCWLQDTGRPNQSQKFALVVDSHLDELPTINARATAIWEGIMLPFNVTLAHASDKPKTTIAQDMLSEADKASKFLRNEIVKKAPMPGVTVAVPKYCSRLRVWRYHPE